MGQRLGLVGLGVGLEQGLGLGSGVGLMAGARARLGQWQVPWSLPMLVLNGAQSGRVASSPARVLSCCH